MKVYLDNCVFNRPFDAQTVLSIKLETEAKLFVQQNIIQGNVDLIWSYMLDYENSFNPYREREETIEKWKKYAVLDVIVSNELLINAQELVDLGLSSKDAIHIACAIEGKANYFLTTDKGIIKKSIDIVRVNCVNPVQFIETLENIGL